MKITSYELYTVPPRWVFLKLNTDEGISGWGEPVLEGRADTVKACVEELSEYFIGKEMRQQKNQRNQQNDFTQTGKKQAYLYKSMQKR